MSGKMTKKEIDRLRSNFSADENARIVQNAVTTTTVSEVALSREIVTNIDESFSTKIDDWKVTNQKASGRCWIFAFLNMIRYKMESKYKLKNFEFSYAYVHFYDKLEKCNYFLNTIYETRNEKLDSRLIKHFLSNVINFPSLGRANDMVKALNPVNVPISKIFFIFDVLIIKCKK